MQRRLLHKLFSLLFGLFILTSLIQTSCKGSRTNLSHAESLLETNPAAADSILCSMPEPQSRRDRAWYAVLKTQADYKQYKPITSDSLILTATSYYGTHRKNYRSAMAWYSQGCVYKDMQIDSSAVESFIRAMDLFPDTLNRFYSLTEQSLGDVFLRKSMYHQAHSMYSCCQKNAGFLNDSAIIAYCEYKIATIYLYERQYEHAKSMFYRLMNNNNLSPFYRNESVINYSKSLIYSDGDIQMAYALMSGTSIKESYYSKGVINSILGIIHYNMCNYDSAYIYFKKSLESANEIYTRSTDYCYLLELSSMMGDTDEAHYYATNYTNIIDSIIVLEDANDVAAVKIEYAQESYKNKRKEYIVKSVFFSVSSFIVLFFVLVFIYQYKIRKYQDYYIKLSDQSRARNVSLSLNPDSGESEILDYCLQVFYGTPSFLLLKEAPCVITNHLRQSIIHDLTVSFSEYYSFAAIHYPGLNIKYINFCILHLLNFSHQQIVDILCLSENNYRVSKTRIRRMLDISNRLYPK